MSPPMVRVLPVHPEDLLHVLLLVLLLVFLVILVHSTCSSFSSSFMFPFIQITQLSIAVIWELQCVVVIPMVRVRW